MKKRNETIKVNTFKIEDIIRWHEEITAYNLEHEETDELVIPDSELKYQIIQMCSYLLSRAYSLESEISADLRDILGENGYFVSFENRFKGMQRLQTIIYDKCQENNGDPFVIGKDMDDVLRYTIIFDDDTYVEKVDDYLTQLEELGYEVYMFNNRWNGTFYKGINTKIKTPCGFVFEIQFHTKENYDVKEIYTREPYKISRRTDVPAHLKIKSYILRRFYQSGVNIPFGVLDYQYISKKDKSMTRRG